jgi:hypothetical protein
MFVTLAQPSNSENFFMPPISDPQRQFAMSQIDSGDERSAASCTVLSAANPILSREGAELSQVDRQRRHRLDLLSRPLIIEAKNG